MKYALAFIFLIVTAICAASEITNAKASLVLDGGSFSVTLSYPKEELRLFVPNPSRRGSSKIAVQVLDEKDRVKEVLSASTGTGKKLHRDLIAAVESKRLVLESKSICAMLDRILLEPDLPWAEIRFPEKWE